MNLENMLRFGAAGACLVLLTAAYQRTQSAPIMTDAAKTFLASLTSEQSKKARMAFEDDERQNFHYVPIERKGLPLREMSGMQKHLAHALLSAGLSQRGYIKATIIMSLEDVLRQLENDNGERRNPEKYYFSIFGEPSATGTWGYRVEGHHLSQNFTVVNGKLASTPSFFGSNPAEVKEGPRKGLRVLGTEEDLGRELYMSLTPAQKKTALVAQEAYKEILTAQNRKAAMEGKPSGLQASAMTAAQKALLMRVLEEYAYNMPEQIAQARMAQIQKSGNNIYFAWAGVAERGGPHYYRVQAPSFVVEYDNTQNNANHVHSVWRDFDGDFGLDLLKQHYQTSHAK